MQKYKFFVNLEKEEQWLNEMAQQGLLLSGKTWMGYEFQQHTASDVVIRIDYRTFKRSSDFNDYRALFEDYGWEHVGGTRSSGSQYFRKFGADSSEDIFSDVDSKAMRYKRLSDMWSSMAASFIPLFAVLVMTDVIDVSAALNPKELYYTPGLWDKEGLQFWGAFLFETPFALARGFSWAIFPVMILCATYFSYKSKKQYDNNKGKS